MNHKPFILTSFCAYFMIAIPFNIQGANAPVTMEYYGITAAQQGFIMTMQSVGVLAASVFIALKGERYNKIHAIAFGIIMFAIMSASIGFAPPYFLLLIVIAMMGVGLAFIDIMTNGAFSEIYPDQKSTFIPLIHAIFGVGAMVTPVFVTLIVNPSVPSSFSYPFRIVGAACAAIFVLYLVCGKKIMPETPYMNMDAMRKSAVENPAEIFKTGRAWYLLVAGFLYFTFQLGIIVWLPTYAIENAGADFNTAGMLLTAFFAGSLVMRFLGPLILRRLSPRLLFSLFGAAAAASMLAAILTGSIEHMFVLVAVSGFMQGSVVATFIIMSTEAFPSRMASASSLFSLAVGAATFTAPLWMGAMSEHTGFRIPMILICCALFVSSGMIFFGGRRLR